MCNARSITHYQMPSNLGVSVKDWKEKKKMMHELHRRKQFLQKTDHEIRSTTRERNVHSRKWHLLLKSQMKSKPIRQNVC